MISEDDACEIILKGKIDGVRLYKISETIYKYLIIFNYIFGIVGFVTVISLLANGMFVVGAITAVVILIICLFNYIGAVLSTHFAKVLVHLLFSNLTIMERNYK